MNSTDKAIQEINALRIHAEFTVTQVKEHHFRINNKWDMYANTRRIFMVGRSDNFVKWKDVNDLFYKLRELEKLGRMPIKDFKLLYILGRSSQTVKTGTYAAVIKRKSECERSGQYKVGAFVIVPNSK
jgi:hypothetical protein